MASTRHTVKCPDCGSRTRVIDSRPADIRDRVRTRRRRECLNAQCRTRITTVEIELAEYDALIEARRTLRRVKGDLAPVLGGSDGNM